MSLSNISSQSIPGYQGGSWMAPVRAAGRALGGLVTAVDEFHSTANSTRARQNLEHALATGAAQHYQTMEHAQQVHELGEAARASEHTRRNEFLSTLHENAEPGTELNVKHGDFAIKYTKRTPNAATAQTPVAAPRTSGPVSLGMPTFKPSAASSPAAKSEEPEQKSEGPKPTVARGAGGRMVSLNPQKSVTKTKKKKSSPKTTGPTVGRGPGGRMVSLKNK